MNCKNCVHHGSANCNYETNDVSMSMMSQVMGNCVNFKEAHKCPYFGDVCLEDKICVSFPGDEDGPDITGCKSNRK